MAVPCGSCVDQAREPSSLLDPSIVSLRRAEATAEESEEEETADEQEDRRGASTAAGAGGAGQRWRQHHMCCSSKRLPFITCTWCTYTWQGIDRRVRVNHFETPLLSAASLGVAVAASTDTRLSVIAHATRQGS